MQYVDFNSKTKQTILRFALYILCGVIAFAISMWIVFAARGYDVDPASGQVIHNGLVLVWSQPESADLYINDVLEEATPARAPLPDGQYNLKLSKAGYRDWRKTVAVSGSEVVKIQNARLFPNNINPREITAFKEPITFWNQTPDQERIVFYQKSKPLDLVFYDTTKIDEPPRTITIPSNQVTAVAGQTGELDFVQWSADARYILVKHKIGNTTEFIRIDVKDEEPKFVNINKVLNQPITNPQFDRSENDFLYSTINRSLRRINLQDNTLEDALVSEVADFRVANDGRLVLVQQRDKNNNLLIVGVDGQIETVLSGPRTKSTQLELGDFEDKDYVITSITPNQAKIIWLDPVEGKPRTIATFNEKNVQVHPVSFTGRFTLISSGDKLITHDFDKLRVFEQKIDNLNLDTLSWFDDGHIVSSNGKQNRVVEYDGTNPEILTTTANFKTYTSRNFREMYTISLDESGFNFLVSNLVP